MNYIKVRIQIINGLLSEDVPLSCAPIHYNYCSPSLCVLAIQKMREKIKKLQKGKKKVIKKVQAKLSESSEGDSSDDLEASRLEDEPSLIQVKDIHE